jgi:tryptophan synthase beta chain
MVARFQSVISRRNKNTITGKEGTENPDYVIACVGGGVMLPVRITIFWMMKT